MTKKVKNTMEETIIAVLAEWSGMSRKKILPTADLVNDLGATPPPTSPMDLAELSLMLEKETGIEVNEEKMLGWKNVQDVKDYFAIYPLAIAETKSAVMDNYIRHGQFI